MARGSPDTTFNVVRPGGLAAMRESEHNQPDPSEPDRQKRAGGVAAGVGGTVSGSIIGFLFVGYVLGEYFDSNPGAAVTGLVVGIVVGFYNLAKAMGINK